MREIAVGQEYQVDSKLLDKRAELILAVNRNVRVVERTGELTGKRAALDERDLHGGEGDHAKLRAAAKKCQEIMEVTAGRTQDDASKRLRHGQVLADDTAPVIRGRTRQIPSSCRKR